MRAEERSLASKECAAESAKGPSAKAMDNLFGVRPKAAGVQGAGPRALRQTWHKIDAAVLKSTEAIIGALIEKAREGNLQAAKFLFEFAGIRREVPAKDMGGKGESLAAVLLSRLDSEKVSAQERRPAC
jgi:hypothetical protein